MNRIDLEIRARSPLAIGKQKPGGSVSEADDYISGSVIRGAIAAQILQQAGYSSGDFSTNGGDFQNLFLGDRPAIFQNAYFAVATHKDEDKPLQIVNLKKVLALPATALSSKNNSGFKTELKKDGKYKNNGVFDTLIDRFCSEAYGHLYDPNCPEDGERVDAFTGFYGIKDGKYYKPSVDKRLLTRVGINRRRAVSEEQILYSIEVMNESKPQKSEPSIYRSSIYVEDDNLAKSLQKFIEDNSQQFRFGGSASRGLGKTEIKATFLDKLPKSDLEQRVNDLNRELTKRWQDWQIFGKPQEYIKSNRKFFTIDLQSDAILTDQWRRTMVISETMLKQFTGIADNSLKLHVAYSSYDYRSGWNAAWGLMKDVELVTNRGGVYLFSVEVNGKSDRFAEWLEALERLEITGIGDRTSEGFGQVQVCNYFHLVLREDAV
ncbi:CRISPR-associated RAMP protein Csx10 [Pseudanabaena sp. FACHB-1277]|uniref:CRISPR-associated RAMP protein Csx10 n=1 Tax=Pseudanabaena cinerea FACHB-1277 TaxID=2949581 RepID=A0A926UY05_9CYAN|nr:CRISPR-associated RAMP protein Csx10 [Pseudanabaena cinerea]MBD2152230.1 CRISPR-associated RAMP protein Csx10 [Pseudanabaena cinerea FACHB-1277]